MSTLPDTAVAQLKEGELLQKEEIDIDDYVPNTAAEKALVRKIDLFLLPAFIFMICFNYMDRSNVGNAKIAGMQTDLGFDSNGYSLILVIFIISYVVFEIPSNIILEKTRPSVYMPVIVILWGVVTASQAAVQSYGALLALRFLVGLLEASFAVGVAFMFGSWYKQNEQGKRFSWYYQGIILSGAFGGIIAGAIIESLDGRYGIAGWRWLFIVEGVCTIVVGIGCYIVLLDFPSQSYKHLPGQLPKLNPEERKLQLMRLKADNVLSTGSGEYEEVSIRHALLSSFTDFRIYGFGFGYMLITSCLSMSYFYPTLVQDMGYSDPVKAQFMTVPIYTVSFCFNMVGGFVADRLRERRGILIVSWLALGTICAIVIAAVYNNQVRYGMICIVVATLYAANPNVLSWTSTVWAKCSPLKRSICMAFTNAIGNLANTYGAYLWPASQAPEFTIGFGVITGLIGTAMITYLVMHLLIRRFPNPSF